MSVSWHIISKWIARSKSNIIWCYITFICKILEWYYYFQKFDMYLFLMKNHVIWHPSSDIWIVMNFNIWPCVTYDECVTIFWSMGVHTLVNGWSHSLLNQGHEKTASLFTCSQICTLRPPNPTVIQKSSLFTYFVRASSYVVTMLARMLF